MFSGHWDTPLAVPASGLKEEETSAKGKLSLPPSIVKRYYSRIMEDTPPAVATSLLSDEARALLSGERVALNLLQRLSGIATLTKRFVEAVQGTGVKILDTRKMTPGLRALEKYALAVGAG